MPEMTIAKGDLIKLDFDIWVESGGRTEILDTTSMQVAQEAKWDGRKSEEFVAQPYEVGLGKFPAALEQTLEGAKVGDTVEKEFSPGEAWGERDPKLIELHSIKEIGRLPEMKKEDAHLDIGTVLTINGRRGRVLQVTAGRVRVDFNDPRSGKSIKARFTVKDKITKPDEMAKAIVEMEYGRSREFSVEHRGDHLTLKIPDRAKFDINWHAAKGAVVDRLRTHLKPATIHLVEEYKTLKREEPASPSETAPAAQAEKKE